MTKKQKTFKELYSRATAERLAEAYKTGYSIYKARAENEIIKEMENLNGYGYRITTAGSNFFSCAYCYKKNNKTMLVYHTVGNRFEFAIDE